jgi:apolipoprotein N-acyltransferase
LALLAALWIAAWPLSRIEWSAPTGKALSVALVQGNIPQLLKWEPNHLENTLGVYASLSEPLWGTELVVWP